jgi:hypothetical protein
LAAKDGGTAAACPFTKTMTVIGSVWGSFGVVYVLLKAVRRVLPIALEPFASTGGSLTLTPVQWRYVCDTGANKNHNTVVVVVVVVLVPGSPLTPFVRFSLSASLSLSLSLSVACTR